ncbi:biotin/lipoyl-containing protein [Lutibacter sp.]|uniref:biotin/lipoyl-containing protein n=1 Tax=Lutibacter sp. TaxID=1925666 RepID=UPI001A33151C|nr:biotin/lipoyl-containing protein [Lutibacter sp.]MBI9041848.1 biotin/lipoyl-binding protein [Lutibacter sp.]
MESNFKVQVNETLEYDFNDSDSENLDIVKLSESKFHVLQNKTSYNVAIEKTDFYLKEYIISVNSNSYQVKISNQLDVLIKKMGFHKGASKKVNDIKAPMPGIILSVLVKENQQVKEGETLLILEAMKMENAITCPKDAIIKNITISVNQTVDKGQLLIELA